MSLDEIPPLPETVADGRPSSDDEDSLEDESPPELIFPPFPKLPSGASLIPFSESEVKGAWIPPFSANREEDGKSESSGFSYHLAHVRPVHGPRVQTLLLLTTTKVFLSWRWSAHTPALTILLKSVRDTRK